jgi:class 3 adenylate cyclase
MPDGPHSSDTPFLERKLATILSADVAEFSRLMSEDEEQTLRTFRGHKQVFESLVSMHRGRIFNTAGDAILAEFGSAVEAVRCATDIQAALRTRNDQLAPSRQVRFRIGINLGDVMLQGQDLMGDGVNVAARLQTAAEPGGICISGSVHDQIRNKLSLSFQSLGERNYKNIAQPVRTFSITEADGRGALPSPKPGGAKSSSATWVAVIVVVLLLLVAGGAYWAYTVSQRNNAEHAREVAAAAQPAMAPAPAPAPVSPIPAPAARTPAPVPRAPTPAVRTPAASAPEPKPELAPEPNPELKKAETVRPTPPVVHKTHGHFDGLYAGTICYGKTPELPKRCYDAEGTITDSKISGRWIMGHDVKTATILTGDVSPSGDVDINIELHDNTYDGTRTATITLTGTLREGKILATGSFRKGRPANLNWRKQPNDFR